MTQKKLEKGSVWEKADANGDGVVSDQEMAMRERMVLLENRDKKEDQQRHLVTDKERIEHVQRRRLDRPRFVRVEVDRAISISRGRTSLGFMETHYRSHAASNGDIS